MFLCGKYAGTVPQAIEHGSMRGLSPKPFFRDLYINDPTTQWFEPDTVTTNISGVAVSAQMWSVLTFYNGTGGCPWLMLAGRRRQVPLEFNPATTNWILHVNSQNYVNKVVSRRNAQETE